MVKFFTELKQKLNIELKKINDWFRCNEMSLNHKKKQRLWSLIKKTTQLTSIH